MAKTLVFPRTHPGGALLDPGEKLIFGLRTNRPAPIFSFKVDAALVQDASTAPHTVSGGLNEYAWEHPTGALKPGEVRATDIAVIIAADETCDYMISRKSPGATIPTLLLQMTFAGPETILRDTFAMVVGE